MTMNNFLKKIDALRQLERKHKVTKVTGVSFAVRKGTKVTLEQSIDNAIDIIKAGSKLIRDKHKLKG